METYKNKGLTILSVNCGEDKATVEEFIKTNGINYPVLLDTTGSISDKYGVEYIPLNALIDLKGKIVHYEAGELPSTTLINKTIPAKN